MKKKLESKFFVNWVEAKDTINGPKLLKLPSLRRQPQTIQTYLVLLIYCTRLPASLQSLNSSLAQSLGELWLAEFGQIAGLKENHSKGQPWYELSSIYTKHNVCFIVDSLKTYCFDQGWLKVILGTAEADIWSCSAIFRQ